MNSKISRNNKKITISFLAIFFLGLGIRIFYFPFELPLVIDAMDNFTYATAINYYGYLPTEWAPANIGWPMFLSFWFSIFNLENTFDVMQIQRALSVIISSLIVIPVYLLCRKFFDEKIALVGASIFAFDPRIVLNSLLGITEPLFILLGISSLVVFLKYDKKLIYIAFILASFSTIIRSEGIFIFFTISILFFIKYRFSKEIIKTYIPCLIIFLIILSPIMSYKIEVTGYDGIFQRVAYGTGEILINSSQNESNHIIEGVGLFVKYLGWIMIPIFIIFVPFGFIQYLRDRKRETNFILVYLVITSLPILYAYIVQAQDTRYLYILYPIFCLISLFAVKKYITNISRKNLVLTAIIIGIFIGSVGFYEYKKIDYQKEVELFNIAEIISEQPNGLNFHPSETRYIRSSELPEKWPFLFIGPGVHEIKSISTSNYDDLESFISDSRNELTHILVDNDQKLPKFLQDVYQNYEQYEYLEKVVDSKKIGFKHHMMLFEIDFEKFDSIGE